MNGSNNIITRSKNPDRTIHCRDMQIGQYGVLRYGGLDVIVVRTLPGVVGLDGYHTWSPVPDYRVELLEQGEVITITAQEQI